MFDFVQDGCVTSSLAWGVMTRCHDVLLAGRCIYIASRLHLYSSKSYARFSDLLIKYPMTKAYQYVREIAHRVVVNFIQFSTRG